MGWLLGLFSCSLVTSEGAEGALLNQRRSSEGRLVRSADAGRGPRVVRRGTALATTLRGALSGTLGRTLTGTAGRGRGGPRVVARAAAATT